jgi:hypothetical protein
LNFISYFCFDFFLIGQNLLMVYAKWSILVTEQNGMCRGTISLVCFGVIDFYGLQAMRDDVAAELAAADQVANAAEVPADVVLVLLVEHLALHGRSAWTSGGLVQPCLQLQLGRCDAPVIFDVDGFSAFRHR